MAKKSFFIKALEKSYPDTIRMGDFFYSSHNEYAIQGFVIDAPPSRTSVYGFVIPIFDKIEFLHFSLNTLIAQGGPLSNCDDDWILEALNKIGDSNVLVPIIDLGLLSNYVESNGGGRYCDWCIALINFKLGKTDVARADLKRLFNEIGNGPDSSVVADAYEAIFQSESELEDLLQSWEKANREKYFPAASHR
ncbi:MAG TPA: hypothetical protein VGF77_04625 [Allosphingosinicella sp.]